MNKKTNQAGKFKWNRIFFSLPYTTQNMDPATSRNKQETPGLFATSGSVECTKLQLAITIIFDQAPPPRRAFIFGTAVLSYLWGWFLEEILTGPLPMKNVLR